MATAQRPLSALFQQSSDLEADGIAGKYTIRAIFGSCASTADITVSGRDTAQEDEDTATETEASDDDQNVVDSFSEIGSAPDPTQEGDSVTDVIKLQQALYLLGYYTGVIDGDYGAKNDSGRNPIPKEQRNERGRHCRIFDHTRPVQRYDRDVRLLVVFVFVLVVFYLFFVIFFYDV